MDLIVHISDDVYTRLFDNGIEPSESDRDAIDTAIRKGKHIGDRSSGKWIKHIGMNHECPICGAFFPLEEFKKRPFKVNFCIACGAKLEE